MNTLPEQCKKVLYDDEIEKRLHLRAIKILSANAGLSADRVERLYEIVLHRLKGEAKIKDFLPILVSRRVRYLLEKRSSRKEALIRDRDSREKSTGLN